MRRFIFGFGLFVGPVAAFLLLSCAAWWWFFGWLDALEAALVPVAAVGAMVVIYLRLRRRAKPGVPIGAFLAGIIVCGLLTSPLILMSPIILGVREVARRTNYVLNEADHAKLLAACREIMRNHDRYRHGAAGESSIDTEDPMLPEIVRNLDPAHITADNSSVRIAMTGGFHHCGVLAFVDDAENPDVPVTFKLCPGLWFYEDEGPTRGVRYPPGYPQR